MSDTEIALVVGAGPGLSASLTRIFTKEGMKVAIAARDTAKLSDICKQTGCISYSCDAADGDQVDSLFLSLIHI